MPSAITLTDSDSPSVRMARTMPRYVSPSVIGPEDNLHGRDISLEILTGICAGLHKPNGQTTADKMLFMVAAMAISCGHPDP